MTKTWTQNEDEEIIRLYTGGGKGTETENVCLRDIQKNTGHSTDTIRRRLNFLGIDTSKQYGLQRKTLNLVNACSDVAKSYYSEYKTRMTIRFIYYKIIAHERYTHYIKADASGMDRIYKAVQHARELNFIPYAVIEDRTRQPSGVAMWDSIESCSLNYINAFRLDVWHHQPNYFEVWLEKSALYGLVHPVTHEYGVTLQVCKGFSSISAIYDASKRLKDGDTILYLGDHDPSGLAMDETIINKFHDLFGIDINFKRIGLRTRDIEKYNLFTNPVKNGYTRSKKFIS